MPGARPSHSHPATGKTLFSQSHNLPRQLQPELNLTRRSGGFRYPPCAATNPAPGVEDSKAGPGRREIGPIEDIEEFRAELNTELFRNLRNRRAFGDRDVESNLVGSVHRVAAEIPIESELLDLKRRRIKPQVRGTQHRIVASAGNQVRTLDPAIYAVLGASEGTVVDRHRGAGTYFPYPSELPALHHSGHYSRQSSAPGLIRPKGKLPYGVEAEEVARVKVGSGLVPFPVIGVHQPDRIRTAIGAVGYI